MSDDYDMDDLTRTWCLADKLVLPKSPTVVVVGAYKGKVMDFLLQHYEDRFTYSLGYCGEIIGYEPQNWAFDVAQHHLDSVHSAMPWELRPYGLCAESTARELPLYGFGTDACSTSELDDPNLNAQRGEGFFIPIQAEFMDEDNGYEHIDLLIMNAEGAEWDLLPELFKSGMPEIDSLAVQFHEHALPPEPPNTVLATMDEVYERTIDRYPEWIYWVKPPTDSLLLRDDHHRIVS